LVCANTVQVCKHAYIRLYLVPLVLFQGLRPATPFGRVGGLRTGLSGEPFPLTEGVQPKT